MLWALCVGLLLPCLAQAAGDWSGQRIMDEVVKRHEYYPYTFERQSMILQDKAGNRDVRQLRRYSRLEDDGRLNYLLVFDQPAEVRGVTLLATRYPSGRIDNGIYLPAFGPELKRSAGESRSTPFLGTDFTVQDMTPEITADFNYRREDDLKIEGVQHFVITALPKTPDIEQATGYSLRRLYIRQDIFFVVRTDFFDREGHLFKRSTQHDLKRVDGSMWRANMTLMQDFHEQHMSLLKIDQRIFSKDYVPAEIFTPEHILADRNVSTLQDDDTNNEADELEKIELENELLESGLKK